jgi:hypothetical protein
MRDHTNYVYSVTTTYTRGNDGHDVSTRNSIVETKAIIREMPQLDHHFCVEKA